MSFEFLTSEDQVKALMPAWRELHDNYSKSLFTHPEWIMSWWEFLGKSSGYQLLIATYKNKGKLVALAALAVSKRKGLRVLEWAGADVFDYCDSISVSTEECQALWEAIAKFDGYDLALIKDIRPEASCGVGLRAVGQEAKYTSTQFITNHWKNGQEWLFSLGYDRRKKIKQRANQLEKAGKVRFDVYQSMPLPAGQIEQLVEMKIAWSKATGSDGVFAHPGITAFLTRIAELAAASGHLHFSTLSVDDAVISSHLGFVYNDSLYYYITSYDSAWGKYSPGQQLMCKLIFWTIENGLREFDLMRGEERYKSSFSEESLKLSEFSFSKGLKGIIGEWYYRRKQQKRVTI